jgi:hypothetical protein
MILRSISKSSDHSTTNCSQLYENIEEVRSQPLVIEVLSEVPSDLDCLILRELRGACDVQQ